jgi:hypothetical protein
LIKNARQTDLQGTIFTGPVCYYGLFSQVGTYRKGKRKGKMTKERKLKNEAMEACRYRCHDMKRFTEIGKPGTSGHHFYSECRYCKKGVWVVCNPAPNDIDISGNAVALSCLDYPGRI